MAFDYDKLVDRFFVRAPDGRIAFYPWGTLFRGYWVDDETREETLRKEARRFYCVFRFWVPASMIAVVALPALARDIGLIVGIVIFVAPYLWRVFAVARSTNGLGRAPSLARRPRFPRFAELARKLTFTHICFLAVLSLYLAASSTKALIENPRDPIDLGLSFLLWLCTTYAGSLLVVKIWRRIPTAPPSPRQQFEDMVTLPFWIVVAVVFGSAAIGIFFRA